MSTVINRIGSITAALAIVFAASASISGCVTNPATGKSEFSLMSVSQEMALGAEGDQQIIAQFGLYNDQAVASYVNAMGAKVAATADNPGFAFHFRVLDSPVINAFALPGGYIYVTRGLLANLENDAQLAVVLGHEIGHVTARHAAQQYTSAQLANIGLGLGSIFVEEIRPFMGALQTGLQLLFLKFSRSNETQSDYLGVKYATKAGFDAKEGSEFFHSLARLDTMSMKNGGKLPSWAATHPDPGQREQVIVQTAARLADSVAPTGGLGGVNPKEYNGRLDGLVYGPDPRQGFLENGTFYHPDLRFRFSVPSGWEVANFASLLQMVPANGEAVAEMSTVSGGTADAVANSFVSQSKAVVSSRQNVSVNGLSAVRLLTSLNMDDGQGGVVPLTILSYFITKDNLVYVFHGYSTSAKFPQYQTAIDNSFKSFATLTDQGALGVQPYRVDVVIAPSTAPFSSLVAPPAEKRGPGIKIDLFELSVMNQKEINETVTVGTSLKDVK